MGLLHREEYQQEHTERAGVADLNVAKDHKGRTDTLSLMWNPKTTGCRGLEVYDT